ncbi:MAG: M28 family peptidase [Gemmatimonadota bacterium]|nr:MAG: M28 family peptidase [Gemmatimonadota bacterium]
MRVVGKWAMAFAISTVIACGGDSGGDAGGAASFRADRPSFDSARAFRDLMTQVDFGPRVPGTDGHAAQLAWMAEELGALADTVILDAFSHTTLQGEELALTNVLARFGGLGEERGRPVLLLAHWDTRPRSDQSRRAEDKATPLPGANDGASGVAILMELARMFAEKAPPTRVDLLFVDGEDYGPTTADMFLGARNYAETRSAGDAPIFAILLDMVGDQDPRFPIEGYSSQYAPQVAQRIWSIAGDLGYGRYFPIEVGQRVNDDHVSLNEAGVPTVDIIDFDYGPQNSLWHTIDDTPENTSAATLRIVGEVVAEVVYRSG